MSRACSEITCPIDCKMSDWSNWTEPWPLALGMLQLRSAFHTVRERRRGLEATQLRTCVCCEHLRRSGGAVGRWRNLWRGLQHRQLLQRLRRLRSLSLVCSLAMDLRAVNGCQWLKGLVALQRQLWVGASEQKSHGSGPARRGGRRMPQKPRGLQGGMQYDPMPCGSLALNLRGSIMKYPCFRPV